MDYEGRSGAPFLLWPSSGGRGGNAAALYCLSRVLPI